MKSKSRSKSKKDHSPLTTLPLTKWSEATTVRVEDQIKEALDGMRREQKLRLLARLAHEITICAREAYAGGMEAEAALQMLRAYNEVQHRVASQLRHLLTDDPHRYPDGAFVDILLEWARSGDCEPQVIRALQRTIYYELEGH